MPVDTRESFLNCIGDSTDRLVANNFDHNVLRPWLGRDGRSYITKLVPNAITGQLEPKTFVTNTPATLTWDAWKLMDDVVLMAMRDRLRLVADVRGRGLVMNIPNGMAHTVIQYQKTTDMSPATVSMDPVRRGEGDRPVTDVAFHPLPIIHKDFDFSAREVLTARNGQIPIDTGTAEQAARKVAEEIEKMGTGTVTPFAYGGGTIYGLTTLPQRSTKTDMVVPDGTNGDDVVNDILALRQLLITNKHYGPYVLYVNTQWSQWLDTDYATTKGDNTLRQRILAIEDIQNIVTLDYLPSTQYACALVEMNSQTVRAIVGMEVQTIQWESVGGLMKHYKVMALINLQLRADSSGNSGIAHGRTA